MIRHSQRLAGCGARRSRPLSAVHGIVSPRRLPFIRKAGCTNAWSYRAFSSASNPNSSSSHDSLDDTSRLPQHLLMELDFFGEPVTFLGRSVGDKDTVSNAMAAMDGFLLCAVSKGKTCTGGGEEGGLEVQSAHSAAIVWAEALRYAAVWNQPEEGKARTAPMLAVVAVAPVLAQAGVAYVKHLDTLLKQAKSRVPGLPPIQMYEMATTASSHKDDTRHFNQRERLHMQALHHLLQNQYPTALTTYLRILRSCPGDALALSIAMDLSFIVGDKQAALRAAGSVASYWNERRGGFVRPAIPGHSMVASMMALGFAVNGRDEDAEQMAARAMKQGKSVCGGLATWAQAHVFDTRGRIAEGISALANFDGINNYEGSGFLFFDCRLSGYGARFCLDREERGRGKSAALRLYEANFERVLGYSGFSQGEAWRQPLQRAPLSWAETKSLDEGVDLSPSFLDKMLGRKRKHEEAEVNYELAVKQINFPSTEYDGWEPSCEDVLTWLPPTPALLSDATLLLLRFTLNGTISARNARWDNVRNAWSAMLDIQKQQGDDSALAFCPLISVTASLLFPPQQTGGDEIGSGRLAEGLYLMGELLKLGNPVTEQEKTTSIRELIADNDPNFWLPAKEGNRQQWKEIVNHLSAAIDGFDQVEGEGDNTGLVDISRRFQAWDFETRPIFEHAICYAACKSGDTESLCLARSICSQGVTLRPNAPEEWWRYSIVLGLLGDDVGSEDALNNSINFGSGQGSRS